MDGTQELAIMLTIDSDSYDRALSMLEGLHAQIEAINSGYEAINSEAAEFNRGVRAEIVEHQRKLALMRTSLKLEQASVAELDAMVEHLNEAKDAIIKMVKSDIINPNEAKILDSISGEITNVQKRIREVREESSEWRKIFKDFGLENVHDSLKRIATIGAHIGFWASMVKENMEQAKNWRNANLEVYGSVRGIAHSTRNVAMETGILVEEATKAGQALGGMRIDPDNFTAGQAAIGKLITVSDVGADSLANLWKQSEMVGLSQEGVAKQIDNARGAMKIYGLSSTDTSAIVGLLADNARYLAASARDSAAEIEAQADELWHLAGAAKEAGMAGQEFAQIYTGMLQDATKHAILLGDAMMSIDPNRMFLTMASNAGEFVDMLEDMPVLIRNSMSMDLTGMSFEQLKKMDSMFSEYANNVGENENDLRKILAKTTDEMTEQERALAEGYKQFRAAEDPTYAYTQAMESLKLIFVTFVQPLIEVVAGIAKFIRGLIQAAPWLKWVIGTIGVLVTTLVLLRTTIGTLSAAGNMLPSMFSSIGKVLKDLPTIASNALKGIAEGLRQFFTTLGSIDLASIAKTAAVLVIVAAAIGALAWAATKLGVQSGMMLEIAASMIATAIAMSMVSKISNQIDFGGLMKLVIAMSLLAVAIGGVGAAMQVIPGAGGSGAMISFGITLVAFIGAVVAASKLSGQVDAGAFGKVAMGLGRFAVGVGVIGMAMQLIPGGGGAAAMLAIGATIVSFILSVSIASRIAGQIDAGAFNKIAIGMGSFAVGVGAIGIAMQAIPGGGGAAAMLAVGAAITGFVLSLAVASRIAATVDVAAFNKLPGIAFALGILGAALIPLAFAMSLMKDVDISTFMIMAAGIAVLAITLGFLSTLTGPIMAVSVAFLVFGAAVLVLAGAFWIAAQAFSTLAELDLLSLAGGLIALGAATLAAGAMMIIGMPLIMAAMLIGAALLVPAMIFWVASLIISAGLSNIGEGLQSMAGANVAGIGLAFMMLAVGMVAIVASPWVRFWIASKTIKWGLQNIAIGLFMLSLVPIDAIGPALIQIANAMRTLIAVAGEISSDSFEKLFLLLRSVAASGLLLAAVGPSFIWAYVAAGGLSALNNAMVSLGSSDFKGTADQMKLALKTMASGLDRYAYRIEASASRVVNAISDVVGAASLLSLFGLDDIVKSSSAVSVKAELEDKREEADYREESMDMLESIRDAINNLIDKVDSISGASGLSEDLAAIRDATEEYLPEIAEGNKGLGAATSNW